MHISSFINVLEPQYFVYIAIGIASAKMLMEKDQAKSAQFFGHIQFAVKASSIIILWPLVLFIDKFEDWIQQP